jgi:hypothetical protein
MLWVTPGLQCQGRIHPSSELSNKVRLWCNDVRESKVEEFLLRVTSPSSDRRKQWITCIYSLLCLPKEIRSLEKLIQDSLCGFSGIK